MDVAEKSHKERAPTIVEHDGVFVVRDDMHYGGTKARLLAPLFASYDEIVYATPAEGGAQSAIAAAAKQFGKRATLFVAERKIPHARQLLATSYGAKIVTVKPGYLTVVQARARQYSAETGAYLLPFGAAFDGAIEGIADAALSTGFEPDEVWCASGSGTLARGLALAWPNARRHVVQVGRELVPDDVSGAKIHIQPLKFEKPCKVPTPFPSDPHYDAKAWHVCQDNKGKGRVLFWNVTGPA